MKSTVQGVSTSLRGTVETVFYSSPTFTAGRLRLPDGSTVNFAGKLYARPNDAVRLEGHWAHHAKYGRQFAAETLGYDLELDPDGLAQFLARSSSIRLKQVWAGQELSGFCGAASCLQSGIS